MIKVNNIQALTNAIDTAMAMDKKVIVFGEDVGYEGGVFRATKGLQKKYGRERCFDAVLAEAVLAGAGIGMAINGLRPIVEMQFQGFSYPCLQQMFTHAARYRNRTRGQRSVPMVLRMPMGGGVNAMEHHSEATEALFAHVPGLKVIMASTPYDVKGLMLSAIKDNDPVIFLEPKRMYRAFKQEIPETPYNIPIGKGHIIQEGTDITIVTYGPQVMDCKKAIELLKQLKLDYSVELIDLRTIKPWDKEMVLNSVKKTGRLLVVHEAVQSFSVSSEVIATVAENVLDYIKAPLSRLTSPDITVPLAIAEKKYYVIKPERVANRIIKIMKEVY